MTATEPAISVVPANEASWEDLQTVFGTHHGQAARCQCQRHKLRPREFFAGFPAEERAARLREQTVAGQPESDTTSGLVAYLDSDRRQRLGRDLLVHTRGLPQARGVSRALARAAVGFARERGARTSRATP